MDDEHSVRSARNAYYVAMAVAIAFLAKQIVEAGGYDRDVFAVVVLSQLGYWGSVLYYRREEDELPLVDD